METIHSSQNKLIQDSEGNEENGYPVPDSNKTKINYAKELNKDHKNILKEEILQQVTENFMVNQNIQEALKKFQDNKNKEYDKKQKQINELIGALNKYQSETENTINTEINELSTKFDNIKEEVTHDMENLRKKNETEIQNTMEGYFSRLEQAEDRLSELEDEMEIKRKTEEQLVKQLKTCERNMQELTNSIKRPNLRIIGIEEEEVQAKGICNIFNEVITDNFPNLEKTMLIQVQEASRTPNLLDQNRTTPQHIIIKTTSKENRETILRDVREKKQITYKGIPIKITADFSTETLKARRA
jgi:chromosome segregation ATPase